MSNPNLFGSVEMLCWFSTVAFITPVLSSVAKYSAMMGYGEAKTDKRVLVVRTKGERGPEAAHATFKYHKSAHPSSSQPPAVSLVRLAVY